MSIKLTKKELENIKNYRYTTNESTELDKVFDPFWNWCTNMLPNVSKITSF